MSDETGWRISCFIIPQHQTFQEAPEALAQNHSWLALSPQDAPIFINIMKTSLRRLTSPAFPRPPSLWRFSANDHWTFLCTSSVGQSVQSNVKTGIVMYIWNINVKKVHLPHQWQQGQPSWCESCLGSPRQPSQSRPPSLCIGRPRAGADIKRLVSSWGVMTASADSRHHAPSAWIPRVCS